MALNQVSAVPAGVLRVNSGGFFTPTPAFSKDPPTIFRMHMPSGMGTEILWIMGCMFSKNGPLEGGIESSFSDTGWGAKGDFRWIFYPNPCIFEGGLPPFTECTCPQVWAQRVWGSSDVYSRRMGPEKVALNQGSAVQAGVLRVYSGGFISPTPAFWKGAPPPFFECTCPQVWPQKVWGSSDVYSRRMGP